MALTIGIAGTGGVARGQYIPFLSRQEGVSLVYWNRTRQKAEDCAKQFGGRVVGSPAELVEQKPDAILVLTSETARYEVASALLSHAPRRLFFEKPLVAAHGQARVTEDDFLQARMLLQRAKGAGTETAMVFNYRFFDQVQEACRHIRERQWGNLIQATALVHYACWSHSIDLLLWFGGPVAQMSALEGPIEHEWAGKAKDVAASFVFENGATGTILGTQGMSFDFPLFEITLSFEKGRLQLRDLDCEMDVLDYRSRRVESSVLGHNWPRWDRYGASFQKAVGAYLDSIRKGEPPPVPGVAGLQELQFEAALKRSVREHRPVSVGKEFPLEL